MKMKKRLNTKRFVSILLALCMMVSVMPGTALAAVGNIANSESSASVLCENHKTHTTGKDGCGYDASVVGAVCKHECELCKKDKQGSENSTVGSTPVPCENHKTHTTGKDGCGYDASVVGAVCKHECELCKKDKQESENSNAGSTPVLCENHKTHTTGKDGCGYDASVAGAVCKHECELCKKEIPPAKNNLEKEIPPKACTCSVLCTAETKNPNCSICAISTDLTVCKAAPSMPISPLIEEDIINITTDSKTLSGASLEDSLNSENPAIDPAAMSSLKVNRGKFTTADWEFLKNFTRLQTFVMAGDVATVENIPNGTATAPIFPSTIVSVTVPQAITIGNYAFYECKKLINVTLPTVTSIGEYAFSKCAAFKNASFPGVLSIGQYAFDSCTALEGASLPAVISIADNAFSNCTNLKLLSLSKTPPNVANANSFEGCFAPRYLELVDANGTKLQGSELAAAILAYDSASAPATDSAWYGWLLNSTINITVIARGAADTRTGESLSAALAVVNPSDVTSLTINSGTFTAADWNFLINLTALKTFEIKSAVTSVDNMTDTNINAIFPSTIESVTVPQAISIGKNAFNRCKALKSVSFPNATSIGQYAFNSCTALKSVDFPEVTSIADSVFASCTALESADFPKVISIGKSAFTQCSALTSVNFPEVTSIGGYAFSNCIILTSEKAKFPKVTSIGVGAFDSCKAFTSISFPEVTSIDSKAFYNCIALTSIDIPKITSIGIEVFYNCDSLKSVDFPEVTSIGESAFVGCDALKSVSLPNVKLIDDSAFTRCTALKSITLPEVTSIGKTAFAGCDALESASFPAVTSIGVDAFAMCLKLNKLSLPKSPPATADRFNRCPYTRYLVLIDEYGDELEGKELTAAIADYDGYPVDSRWLGWTLRSPIIIAINGNDDLRGTSLQEALGNIDPATITSLTVKEGTFANTDWIYLSSNLMALKTFVIDGAANVADMPDETMTNSLFPKSIESVMMTHPITISEYAFNGCNSLASASFPAVTSIGDSAFNGCTALVRASFSAAASIGDSAFNGCTDLVSASFTTATSIGDSALKGCTALESVTLPAVTSIGDSAFSDCSKLILLSLPQAPPIVGADGFKNGSTPRYLKLVNARGAGLTGSALTDAIAAYNADTADGTANDNLWYGWNIYSTINITINLNDGTKTVNAGESLENALGNTNLTTITSLTVNSGTFTTEDWNYLNKLSALKTFVIERSVAPVENMPNLPTSPPYGSLFPRSIESVTVPQAIPIGMNAFRSCKALKSANFATATSIGDSAFNGCTVLESIIAPTATKIGDFAFYQCGALTSVSFPSVGTIDESVFYQCEALKSVSFPNVTSIGVKTFNECRILEGADFPLVTTIGERAFLNCNAMKSMSLPNVTSIGDSAFDYCSELTTLSLPQTPPPAFNEFTGCPTPRYLNLVDMDGVELQGEALLQATEDYEGFPVDGMWQGWILKTPIRFYVNGGGGVKLSGASLEDALRGSKYAEELHSVEYITVELGTFTTEDWNYLSKLTALSRFVIFDSVELVENMPNGTDKKSVFPKTIESVTVPKAITIGEYAFSGCEALTNVSFPTATSIGEYAFFNCDALTNVSFPAVKSIGKYAFEDCYALKSVSFPAATSIGIYAFYHCVNLNSVNFPLVTSIGTYVFGECTALRNVSFPAVTSIGRRAFYNCWSIVNASFPVVTSMGELAFGGNSLKLLSLPQKPPTVESDTFTTNSIYTRQIVLVDKNGKTLTGNALTTAITDYDAASLPNGDKLWEGGVLGSDIYITINGYWVSSSRNIENALYMAGIPLNEITSLTINAGTIDGQDWRYLERLTALKTFVIDASVAPVENMPNINKYDPIFSENIESITIPQAIPLCDYAFKYCSALKSVNIPAVTSIGEEAFYDCSALESASFPNVTKLEDNAFLNCSKLKKLNLPKTPPTVGTNTFSGCPSSRYLVLVDENGTPLTGNALATAIADYDAKSSPNNDGKWEGWNLHPPIRITINGNEDLIGADLKEALSGKVITDITSITVNIGTFTTADWKYLGKLSALKTFVIDGDVATVADIPDAPMDTGQHPIDPPFPEYIESVTVPHAITIGDNAFFQSRGLESVSFPAATSIGDNVFNNCEYLTSINFPAVTSIGIKSFSHCDNIESASFPAATSIGVEVFDSPGGTSKLASVSLPVVTSMGEFAFNGSNRLKTICLPKKPPKIKTGALGHLNNTNTHNIVLVNANGTPLNEAEVPQALIDYDTDKYDNSGVNNKWYDCTLPTTATDIKVTPKEITVKKGNTYQFAAEVTSNGPYKGVKWRVEGGKKSTTINSKGLLSIGADETASTLTIFATPNMLCKKSVTATVKVTGKVNAVAPAVNFDVSRDEVNYLLGMKAKPLKIIASSSDGGTLSYQWKDRSDIPGETSSTYTPSTDSAGKHQYICEVTNTIKDNGDGGIKTATITSHRAYVNVAARVHAEQPQFRLNLSEEQVGYLVGTHADSLKITAFTNYNNGKLSYQWYSNTINSNTGGKPISKATTDTYIPKTDSLGTTYYYCVVTNTIEDNGDGGEKRETATSKVANIKAKNKDNAVAPTIDKDLVDTEVIYYINGNNPQPMEINASASDGGKLSYQWYSNSVNSSTDGKAITGEINNTYTPPTTTKATTYYYCEVTNTLEEAWDVGITTASNKSEIAMITVKEKINAKPPTITTDLSEVEVTYVEGAIADALEINAESTDGGTLSYQWYSNMDRNTNSGSLISGATMNIYTPPATTPAATWYYCVVTNTISTDDSVGITTASTTSKSAYIKINAKVKAQAPTIIIDLSTEQATYTLDFNVEAMPLEISASASDNGTLSYQWYKNNQPNSIDAAPILGATEDTYTPSIIIEGYSWYYCVVTNTIEDNSDGGIKTAIAISSIAPIYVNMKKNALAPIITTNLTIKEVGYYIGGTPAKPLKITAETTDNGTLSYQWYSRAQGVTGINLIADATTDTYTPPITTEGTIWYYCVVTNTIPSEHNIGQLTATAISRPATITAKNKVNANTPKIITNLSEEEVPYVEGTVATPLNITAEITDDGTLSYQWYSNTVKNNTSGKAITDATKDTYTPPTTTEGTTYYYCKVINTLEAGESVNINTATDTSSIANIKVNKKVNAKPPTIVMDIEAELSYVVGAIAKTMEITAFSSDNGTLSYQWYRNTDKSNTDGIPIADATTKTYTPITTTEATTYYYCVVTNTIENNNDGGIKTATVTSKFAMITVKEKVNAKTPTIITDLNTEEAGYVVGANAEPMEISASASDNGALSYQWYSNTQNSSNNGTVITGAITDTYTPPTTTTGTIYYYCEVTNTIKADWNVVIKTATAASSVAKITVNDKVNAETPKITTNLKMQEVVYYIGGTAATALEITAETTDKGTLSYQWYSHAQKSTGSIAIPGATMATYTPPINTEGTIWYYCVVTNTIKDGEYVGIKTATAISRPAYITVKKKVNAEIPKIITDLSTAEVGYIIGANAEPMEISASASDNGKLSYQWYSNDVNNYTGGKAIYGAITNIYTPTTTTPITTYYYCVVTNEISNNNDGGIKTATAASSIATITVNDKVNAATPKITTNLKMQEVVYYIGDTAATLLEISAESTDNGTLSYQWYSHALSSTGSILIDGATTATYTPPINTPGTIWYFCVVTNTIEDGEGVGIKTASTISRPAYITVKEKVNAETPTIITDLSTDEVGYVVDANAEPMEISASASDNGTLSYQWYSNDVNKNTGGTVISGAITGTYTPPTTTEATVYYYCVVTNEISNNNDGGIKTATAASSVAMITVNKKVNAATPKITTNLKIREVVYYVGGTAEPLKITVESTDGGVLSYQWYSNDLINNTGSIIIDDAITDTYTPSINTEGNTWYFCVITNTIEDGEDVGIKTASTISRPANITVKKKVNAATPKIITNLSTEEVGYVVGAIAEPMEISALADDNGTLTYQWYSNTQKSSSNGTVIPGAITDTYTPTTTPAGTTYYYCVVTNTISGDGGIKTATATSSVATITVNVKVNAATPKITTNLKMQEVVYYIGSTTASHLKITAESTDGGTLSYQWYSHALSSTGSIPIDGAITATYTPLITAEGTTRYFCVVTNTIEEGERVGIKTASTISRPATITVNEKVNAATPKIITDLSTTEVGYVVDTTAVPLTITSLVSDNGTLSYQWYSNSVNSSTGGAAIEDAAKATYIPPTTTEATTYYYCVVTNEIKDNYDGGIKTATATSSVAMITVNDKVNAAAPKITTNLKIREVVYYIGGTTATPLKITVESTDGGTLSYQWYSHAQSSTGSTAIDGATSDAYTPRINTTGKTWYYCVVTNTIGEGEDVGIKTATTISRPAFITVKEKVNAKTPTITTDLSEEEVPYFEGAAAIPLNITAESTDDGTLSYKWYSHTAQINRGGKVIADATTNTYTPPTTTPATTYFYCVVTNKIIGDSDGGLKTATVTSKVANIKVNEIVNAVAPKITTDLSTAEVPYVVGTAATPLNITAEITGDGTLSYQWYSNTQNNSTSGTVITGASTATYTPSTTTSATTYYYCVVTNTIDDNKDGGIKTATVASKVAMITVSDAPIPKYPITVTNGTANPATAKAGDTVTITANQANSGEQFKKWTTTDNVSFANDTAATTTIIMPNKAVAVMATYENIPAPTPTADPGGGIVTPPTAKPTARPVEKPRAPVSGSVNTTAAVDSNGNATVNITDKNLSDALKAVQNEANKKGVIADEVTVVVNVTTDSKNANAVSVNLPKSVQQKIISNKIDSLIIVIDKPNIAVRLNMEAITEMNKQANADIQLMATPADVSKLSTDAKAAIGTRPAFDMRATYTKGTKNITDLKKGMLSVAISYTLTNDETEGGMYAVYVDSKGKVNYLTNSSYDEDNKMLLFSTNHLSVYGVSYKAPTQFTDISTHWAKTDIEFATGRDLMSGISDTSFKPDDAVTRGMIVTALGKLADVNVSSYKADKFSDVKADAYYAPYANWAAEKNILAGTSKTLFSPDKEITRQEMAVIMNSYFKLLEHQAPRTRRLVTFADNIKISSKAKNAIKAMQIAGILNGKDSNILDPDAIATRGEFAALLHRYVAVMIAPITTVGWTTNDSGTAMYYENGKAVTGRKIIDGKGYSFNSFGETTLPETAIPETAADKTKTKK